MKHTCTIHYLHLCDSGSLFVCAACFYQVTFKRTNDSQTVAFTKILVDASSASVPVVLQLRENFLPLESAPTTYKIVSYMYPIDSPTPSWDFKVASQVIEDISFPDVTASPTFAPSAAPVGPPAALALVGVEDAVASWGSTLEFAAVVQYDGAQLNGGNGTQILTSLCSQRHVMDMFTPQSN